jgi:hypothetical protein
MREALLLGVGYVRTERTRRQYGAATVLLVASVALTVDQHLGERCCGGRETKLEDNSVTPVFQDYRHLRPLPLAPMNFDDRLHAFFRLPCIVVAVVVF